MYLQKPLPLHWKIEDHFQLLVLVEKMALYARWRSSFQEMIYSQAHSGRAHKALLCNHGKRYVSFLIACAIIFAPTSSTMTASTWVRNCIYLIKFEKYDEKEGFCKNGQKIKWRTDTTNNLQRTWKLLHRAQTALFCLLSF